MKLIVGLGNPGRRYQKTRHNVGFMIVERLSQRWNLPLDREKFNARFGDGEFAGHRLALLQPQTYMNLSGESVLAACRFYRAQLEDLLVISDDLALPLGRIRLRSEGSSGGQKGLGDIERRIGTTEYPRLRVGIGNSSGFAVDYVLSGFEGDESDLLLGTQDRAADAVECWITHGIGRAMSAFNRAADPTDPTDGTTLNEKQNE